jgi:hypothetical protein
MAKEGKEGVFYIIEGSGPSAEWLGLAALSFVMKSEDLRSKRNVSFRTKNAVREDVDEITLFITLTEIGNDGFTGIITFSKTIGPTSMWIPRNTLCKIGYCPRKRAGKITIIPENEKKVYDIIILSSDPDLSHPAFSLLGGSEKRRVILLMTNGGLEEIFRGEEFSQKGYEEKRGNGSQEELRVAKKRAIEAGSEKLANEVFS